MSHVHIPPDRSVFKRFQQELINSIRILSIKITCSLLGNKLYVLFISDGTLTTLPCNFGLPPFGMITVFYIKNTYRYEQAPVDSNIYFFVVSYGDVFVNYRHEMFLF